MVMAMRHGLIPPTLHVDAPSSQVDWTAGAVRLATESTAWPETGRARRAGVSSFGISGTNAHIILEQPEVVEIVDAEPAPGVVPWVVAARSDTALTEQLDRVRSAARTVAPADIGFSLASGRSVFDHRAVLLSGKEIARGVAVDRGVVFVFSGQGSQRVGMGRELYARYPVFAEAFDEVCAHLEVSLDEECVENTGRAQPALFAIEVALFRLLSSWGVRPDYLIGHSVGEIAAAYVAGVLSLGDACRLMAARARLMQTLPEGGVMVAVRATEAEVASLLSAEVSLAAVNGPDSVVLSGPEDAVRAAAVALEAEGRKVTELRVSHAFHSTLMRPMLREFRETVTALSFSPPEIPIVSTVTGTPIDEDRWCSPEYWVEQVERTVRFADALSWAGEHGVSAVLEVGPGGGLAAVAPEILGGDTISTALLRADRDEQATVLTAIAHLHVHGVPVDWTTLYPGARKVDVPTYPFQHKHFWPNPGRASTGDAAGFGLAPVDHPLLSAGVELPGSGGFLCTGRISLSSAPWLADHVVMGSVLFPGTGFLELVACAAGQVGCGRIDELTVHVPLVLPEHDGVDIQVVVESPEKSAAREVRVFARVERSEPWVCRASGAVSTAEGTAVEGDMLIPHDAIPVDITDFHAHAAEAGFDYGPAFQGLVAVRSVGETVFAEVALPVEEHAVAARFALHPALLDVALHAIWFTEGDQASRGLLPFSWQGVRVHTTGATAARVRLRRTASDTLSLLLTDDRGTPIASVDSLTLRELPAGALDDNATAVVANSLFTVQWTKVSTKDVPAPDGVVVRTARGEDTDAAEATHGLVKVLLDRMRTWLAEPGQDQRPMVIVTSGAVDTVTDIAASAVWGLVRSAQAEHPDRFVLVDTDDIDGLPARLGAVLATGEPQILIRDGALHKARLTALPAPLPAIPDLGEGWVLVTGGGGGLAGVIVRHLVDDKAVRRVLLVGRRRPEAETVAELVAHGVEAVAVACDVADREAVRRLFDEFPITGVMHTAGVLDDAVITSLTPQRLDSVLRPKVDGAWNLHEASAGRDLAAFVVFSSAAGVVGSAGQGNYAAGNAFLDGLIAHRRANGLPGVSLAWGAWDQSAGMTAGLRARDLARLARTGFPPLTAVQGTALFDAALAADQPLVLPVRVARRVLATQPGPLPALLRDLAPSRTAQRPSGTVDLATIAPAEREGRLLEVVRTEVAAVLGHPDSTAITPDRPFSDLGFDSLTAVELRNRLAGVTGVRLAATLVFDHPTPAALAASLGSGITEEPTASPDAQDLVTRLYRQALADGKTTEADQLLMSLARLRPVVHDSAGLDRALKPTRLAAGGDGTRLVCLGPIVPLTGDRVYHRLASAFQGDRDVSALTPLGFTPGDPLPADARALVAVLADAVAGHVDAAPFALLGLSSGGLLAFEVAKALTARGLRPEAAVLIDTYAIDDPRLGEFQQEMAQAMYGRGDAAAPEAINQTSLSAHVWTCALFEDWRPEPAPFPTLLVRASEPLTAGRTDFGWQTSLDHITTTVDVPGNHFTMADEHIGSTAETINAWLADREQHQ
jgi:malonyl CoA-acyl carrier protein transacylase/thioesterase domain-containing protein/acyl carrier protein